MKPGDGIAFGKRQITIEDSMLAFLFTERTSIKFPEIPQFFYRLKPYFLLVLASLLYLGYLDSPIKEISIFLLIISALSIKYARFLQKKYRTEQYNLETYRLQKKDKLKRQEK